MFLTFLAISGCGKGKSGAVLRVTTSTLSAASSKPELSKTLLAARGDQTGDGFTDQFLTPSAFTVAFKSFKLLQVDATLGLGQPVQTYTLFDQGFDFPKVIELKQGEAIDVVEMNNDPPTGAYNRIQYEISYFEMTIPLCDAANSCQNRRLRFYLTNVVDPALNNFSATAFDLLLTQSSSDFDFAWISAAQGTSVFFPITGPRPVDAVQVPSTQFDVVPASPLFSATIPDLTVPTKPNGKYDITLTFDLTNLFFFDNTDDKLTSATPAIDPAPPFHFNALADISASFDGKFRRACGVNVTAPCATEANFWPGLPVVSPTIVQETPQNTGTTTPTQTPPTR